MHADERFTWWGVEGFRAPLESGRCLIYRDEEMSRRRRLAALTPTRAPDARPP